MDFIKKSIEKHNNKYDYSKVNYKNTQIKVCIICPHHGDFWQRPIDHLKTGGCKLCGVEKRSNKRKQTLISFIEKCEQIHVNKYDYSKVNYKNVDTKITIICPNHGEFYQRPYNHKKGEGCPKCAKEKKSNRIIKYNKSKNLKKDEFIEKCEQIHGNKYDYSKVNYKNMHTEITITCPKHGDFYQLPHNHLQPNDCPKCSKVGFSKIEKELLHFIKNVYSGVILENIKGVINGELDIYLPDLKLAFEFNGLYWHSEKYKENSYHLRKTEECEKQEIHLIHIYEDDWIYKQDIVKSRILNLLGKSNRIFARKCIIKEVNGSVVKEFLKQNHLQGYCPSKINLGLYYNNELVSLMTFGKSRKILGYNSNNNSYELLRFCNNLRTVVIGSANKLFKYFITNYWDNFEIISYADRSWTMNNGNSLYNKLGFEYIGNTKINYFYVIDSIRRNRFNYRKDVLVKNGFDVNKSEHEIMLERNIYRIYNSGNLKYVWNK